MAHPYPYENSAQMLYWPAHGPAFFEGWKLPEDTNHENLLCAEMCRLAYADRGTVDRTLPGIKFELRHWIGGETAEQRGATNGTDGFIATRDDGLTILAFRGTESNKPEDILTDALASSVPWTARGKVHRGFARTYALVRGGINKALAGADGRLLITGHSLGAGLATLAAADLATRHRTLITFGSPRVGDSDFKQGLADVTMRRFVDCCDLVTRIPPERFDEHDIETLFIDLMPIDLRSEVIAMSLIRAIAAGLAGALAALGVQPQYEHVCEATYGDRTGKLLQPPTSATTSAIAADQLAARKAYRGSVTPDVAHLMRELVNAVFAAGVARDAAAIRAAVRDFGARLFQGDPVPLRDLADHTPINYVSLFTGRVG